jgi:MerR family transcriptional regulator, thiopeptide resistance regulator
MLTVSRLARRFGLSRTTLLYYERAGLLKAAPRTSGNYRKYGEKDVLRLEQICTYRAAGLQIKDIRTILDRRESDAATVLRRRLVELNAEIERIRGHQRAILKLLQHSGLRTEAMTKEKWVSIMKAAGLTEDEMRRWHTEFERSAPEEHQEFLQYLQIPANEIRTIREKSRNAATS